MSKYKVSVVVPVFNVEKYLTSCVESLKAQTLKNIEILLIDDGSTDKSGAICDRYAKENENIFVYHKLNEGLGEARNYGVQYAKGDFIAFVDSDDKVAPNMLEVMYNRCWADKTKLGIYNFTLWFPSKNKKSFIKDLNCSKIYNGADFEYDPMVLNRWSHNLAWRKLYHRSLFKRLQFPKGLYHEDIGAWYATMALVDRISIETNCLYIYRKDKADSISNNKQNEELRKDHFLSSFEFGYKKIKQYAAPEREDCLMTSLLDGFLRLPFPSERKEWRKKYLAFLYELYPYYKNLPKETKSLYWSGVFPDITKTKVRILQLFFPFCFVCRAIKKFVFAFVIGVFRYILNFFSLIKHIFSLICEIICFFCSKK